MGDDVALLFPRHGEAADAELLGLRGVRAVYREDVVALVLDAEALDGEGAVVDGLELEGAVEDEVLEDEVRAGEDERRPGADLDL